MGGLKSNLSDGYCLGFVLFKCYENIMDVTLLLIIRTKHYMKYKY